MMKINLVPSRVFQTFPLSQVRHTNKFLLIVSVLNPGNITWKSGQVLYIGPGDGTKACNLNTGTWNNLTSNVIVREMVEGEKLEIEF